MSEQPKCDLCGEPMPEGEEMFNYHGYSGPCPKTLPPKPDYAKIIAEDEATLERMRQKDREKAQRELDLAVLEARQDEHKKLCNFCRCCSKCAETCSRNAELQKEKAEMGKGVKR